MESFNIRDFMSYFWSKLYVVTLFLLLALIAGNLYTCYLQKPMYSSETTLILVNENINKGDSIDQSDILLNQTLVTTYSEIIKSRKVLSEVILNLNLDTTTKKLAKNISVISVKGTEIIRIRVNNEDNEKANLIANEIIKVFSNEVQKIYNIQNISIVDEAEINEKPYNVNYVKQEILYSMSGILFGFMIVFLIYYFDDSIKKAEDIEKKLGLTVIGQVPTVNK